MKKNKNSTLIIETKEFIKNIFSFSFNESSSTGKSLGTGAGLGLIGYGGYKAAQTEEGKNLLSKVKNLPSNIKEKIKEDKINKYLEKEDTNRIEKLTKDVYPNLNYKPEISRNEVLGKKFSEHLKKSQAEEPLKSKSVFSPFGKLDTQPAHLIKPEKPENTGIVSKSLKSISDYFNNK